MNLEYKYYGRGQIRNISEDLLNGIIEHNRLFDDIPWGQSMFNYLNNIKEPPKCSCGNNLNFFKFNKGYSRFCSQKCRSSSKELKQEIKQSFINKYGVDNPLKSKEIREERKKKCLEKHGVEHHSMIPEIIKKKKQTNIKKYGVTTNLLHEDTINKSKKTTLKRYGVEHNSQSEKIKEKKRKTNLEKFGVECNFSSEETKNKTKSTNLKKYGVEYNSQSKEIRRKQVDSWLKNKLLKICSIINHPVDKISVNGQELTIYDYCEKHPVFKISKNLLHQRWFKYNKKICTECHPVGKFDSIIEKTFAEFFESLNINHERNTRKVIHPLEIDIYIPDKNLAFEFNGLYWHSDLFKDENYHLNKTKLCEENGVQLIHVFEDEWIYKQDIVKSIIKAKLGLYENKYFARNCEVKEIKDNNIIKDFLNQNHIQGFVGSKTSIGLYYNDELVSIMCFGKKRVAMGVKENTEDDYELLRYCNKQNTQVVGGASKILKFFIKQYNPKSIMTFADRRYGSGELYEKLGFSFIKETKPNYWYFNQNDLIRYHRFNFRKDKLIKDGYDPNKTEREIMIEKNYHRIYDSGNKKFEIFFY